MIWVRMPDGTSYRYNSANFVTRFKAGYSDLSTKEGGGWVAQVPNTAIIEVVEACAVWNPTNASTQLQEVLTELRKLKRYVKEKTALAKRR